MVVAGIPKTIDNDIEVSGTHFCTLYDSALNDFGF